MMTNERLTEIQNELFAVCPEASRSRYTAPYVSPDQTVAWFATCQYAWTDECYGWSLKGGKNDSETRYWPCSTGGFFMKSVRSIGD